MPIPKHIFPSHGKGVGGVSGRPTRAVRIHLIVHVSHRNGERHPGSQEAGSLRGLPEEREPRSVRLVSYEARSHAGDRTDDSGCPLGAEEGNVVSVRQAHALRHSAE